MVNYICPIFRFATQPSTGAKTDPNLWTADYSALIYMCRNVFKNEVKISLGRILAVPCFEHVPDFKDGANQIESGEQSNRFVKLIKHLKNRGTQRRFPPKYIKPFLGCPESRLQDLQKCILSGAAKFVCVLSSSGNLSLFEITSYKGFSITFPKILDVI